MVPVIVDAGADDDVIEALDVAVTTNWVVANFFPDSDTAAPMSNTAPGVLQHE